MNKQLFSSLICITVLTFAPACNKKKIQSTQPEINTMIEMDNTIFETEEIDTDNDQKSNAKF